jgi:hypothetical protein|tara:strand:- start:923 stop:1369 length:447 start_codon:yes stop_codon:yes gene_type:complete
MTAAELREKIRSLALQVVGERSKSEDAAEAYDELTKFPELKDIIVALLTHEFDSFLEGIDWVAPRPSTFRINLLNGQNFLLTFGSRSWIAQVEGKKYYLLNLDEEEFAAQAIARILQYGPASGAEVEGSETDSTSVEDEVDVDVDVEA